jgi:hypothetical protein
VVKRIAQLDILIRFTACILAQPGARLNGCSPTDWQLKVRTRILHTGHLDHSGHFLSPILRNGIFTFEVRPGPLSCAQGRLRGIRRRQKTNALKDESWPSCNTGLKSVSAVLF